MKRIKYIVIGLIAVLQGSVLLPLSAQTTPPPAVAQSVYECDFEDAEECSRWIANQGPRADLCTNNWYIGQAGNITYEGDNGLFVSNDGVNATYSTSSAENVVVYRDIQLPAGDYVIMFDWRCRAQASSAEGIWVLWAPDTVDLYTSRTYRAKFVDDYRIDTVLNSSTIWQPRKIAFTTDGSPSRLAFVWTNSNKTRVAAPSASVDNIVIMKAENVCPAPHNFSRRMNGTTMQVRWDGDADWYSARVFDYQTGQWQIFPYLTIPRLSVDGLSQGVVQVYVQAHCAEGSSEYVLYTPFYFIPGYCINYLAIDDPAECTTYVGSASAPKGISMLVDSGYMSIHSRHTIHYIPGETDPRTNNMLSTIPEGALASVRLGNWNSGAEGEAIEYTYTVPDDENAVLKLRYAIVLNQPETPHPEEQQSSFSLDITYKEQRAKVFKPLENGCGHATFHIGYGDQTGWHDADGNVKWKEWTEVAVNLREYKGKQVRVTLQSADCTQGGHFSYAYFTLDCESGELEGLNCGEDNPSTDFIAPAGFEYRWYLASNPSEILSTEQTFHIEPMDTMLYNVDVISLSKDKCYFTLDACGIPRYPVPSATLRHDKIACQNIVTFYNKSYIYYNNKYRDNPAYQRYTNGEKIQEVIWDFGDGEVVVSSADSIVHIYKDADMDVTPSITASIAGGACYQTFTFPTLHLKDLSQPEIEKHISVGDFYNGKFYMEAPYSFDEIVDKDDCEQLVHVYVHEKNFRLDTTFCEGGYYHFGGENISVGGKYVHTFKNIYGLDSIVTLNLNVIPTLQITVDSVITQCSDNPLVTIPYSIVKGVMDTLVVRFGEKAQQAGFKPQYGFAPGDAVEIEVPATLQPAIYEITLDMGTEACPVPVQKLQLRVNYSSAVILEKGPFLIVQTPEYNGGYQFVAYQWFRNGIPLSGETNSFLIVSEQDLGAEFNVMLTLADGSAMPSCSHVYGATTSVGEVADTRLIHPSYVSPAEIVYVESDEPYELLSIAGQCVTTYPVSNCSFYAPRDKGIYMVRFLKSNRTEKLLVH